MSLTWLFSDRPAKSKALAPITLKNIHIASPCRADWAKMSGDDRVRHCAECKLNVFNLSELSRRAAEELIARHEGRLCVRFYRRADGTVITQDCPVGFRQLARKVSRIAGTALSALMSVSFGAAQTTPGQPPQATTQDDQNKAEIMVTVIDPQGAIVVGAQVVLVEKETGIRFSATSNQNGLVDLSHLKPGSYTMEITAKWFLAYSTIVNLTSDKVERVTARLPVDPKASVTVELGVIEPLVETTNSTVVHVFEGDLLKAGSPR